MTPEQIKMLLNILKDKSCRRVPCIRCPLHPSRDVCYIGTTLHDPTVLKRVNAVLKRVNAALSEVSVEDWLEL